MESNFPFFLLQFMRFIFKVEFASCTASLLLLIDKKKQSLERHTYIAYHGRTVSLAPHTGLYVCYSG